MQAPEDEGAAGVVPACALVAVGSVLGAHSQGWKGAGQSWGNGGKLSSLGLNCVEAARGSSVSGVFGCVGGVEAQRCFAVEAVCYFSEHYDRRIVSPSITDSLTAP